MLGQGGSRNMQIFPTQDMNISTVYSQRVWYSTYAINLQFRTSSTYWDGTSCLVYVFINTFSVHLPWVCWQLAMNSQAIITPYTRFSLELLINLPRLQLGLVMPPLIRYSIQSSFSIVVWLKSYIQIAELKIQTLPSLNPVG